MIFPAHTQKRAVWIFFAFVFGTEVHDGAMPGSFKVNKSFGLSLRERLSDRQALAWVFAASGGASVKAAGIMGTFESDKAPLAAQAYLVGKKRSGLCRSIDK